MKQFKLLCLLTLAAIITTSVAYSQRISTRSQKPLKTVEKETKTSGVHRSVQNPSPQFFNKSVMDVTIGSETNTGYSLPIEPNYGYSYTQSIYLQSEVGAAGYIGRIAYYYAPDPGYEGMPLSKQWKIYMSHTTKTEFSDVDEWEDISAFTLVYDETIENPLSEGWIYFDIVPFNYDGISNLVIAVEENQPGYDDDEDEFYCSATPEGGYRSLTYYSDYNNPEPLNPPSAEYLYDYIPNIMLSSQTIGNDLKAFNINAGTAPYSANQQISVDIRNLGLNPQTVFDIKLTVNGNSITDTYNGSLASGDVYTHTFSATFDFSIYSMYYLTAEVIMSTDETPANNITTKTIMSSESVIVGNDMLLDESLPIEPFYGYSYSQSIYLQSEIGNARTINRIGYQYSGGSGLYVSNEWKIYMANSTVSEFVSTTDWIDISNFTLVFDGTIPATTAPGWIFFDITPFSYDGTSNLVIAVEENQSNYDDSNNDFYCSYTPEGGARSLYYYSDVTNPDPASPPESYDYIDIIPNLMIYVPFENDLAVTDIVITPPFTANQTVGIMIKNIGTNTQTNFNVSYTYNGNTYSETYNGTFIPNQETLVLLSQPLDMSVSQIYTISANVALTGDQDIANDNMEKPFNCIYNYNALAFDGDYNVVEVQNNLLLNPSNISIEAWIYSDQDQSWAPVVIKNDWSGDDIGYGMYIDNDYVYFFVDNYSDNVEAQLMYGEWTHVAGTYDGTEMKIYINGVLTETLAYTIPVPVTTQNLTIGCDNRIDYPFVGIYDEIRIWDRALTETEILTNMHKELDTTVPINGLILYFPFNQGIPSGDNTSISIVYDMSGNGLNGMMKDFVLEDGNNTSNFVNSEAFLLLEDAQDINTCSDDLFEISLFASGSVDMTYQWQYSDDGGATFSDLTESAIYTGTQTSELTVDFSAANEDNFYICILSDYSGTVVSDTVSIIRRDVPVAFAGDDDDNCGNIYVLEADEPTPDSGEWTIVSGAGNFNDNTAYNATFTASSYGQVTFTWTVMNDYCQASDDVVITFYEEVSANAGSDITTCDDFTTLGATIPTVGTGIWSTSGTASIDDDLLYNTDVTDLEIGSNLFVWTVENGTCSDYAEVEVYVFEDVVITTQPQNLVLNEGQTAIFAVDGNGDAVSFQWQKDGIDLMDGGNISGATTGTLTITNVSLSDAGDYQLLVEGECNNISSDEVTLDVIVSAAMYDISSFGIYPNPSNGMFDITFSNIPATEVSVTVQSVDGKTVYSSTLTSQTTKIYLKDIAAGMYNIQISDNGKIYNQRLIIK